MGSFPHTLLHFQECECDSWVTFSAHTFPCPCLGRKSKVRVAIENLLRSLFNQWAHGNFHKNFFELSSQRCINKNKTPLPSTCLALVWYMILHHTLVLFFLCLQFLFYHNKNLFILWFYTFCIIVLVPLFCVLNLNLNLSFCHVFS